MNAPAEYKDGSLLFEGPVEGEIAGYGKVGRRKFVLAVVPADCEHRELKPCGTGCERWWCNRDGPVVVNPGVCARCLGQVAKVPVWG